MHKFAYIAILIASCFCAKSQPMTHSGLEWPRKVSSIADETPLTFLHFVANQQAFALWDDTEHADYATHVTRWNNLESPTNSSKDLFIGEGDAERPLYAATPDGGEVIFFAKHAMTNATPLAQPYTIICSYARPIGDEDSTNRWVIGSVGMPGLMWDTDHTTVYSSYPDSIAATVPEIPESQANVVVLCVNGANSYLKVNDTFSALDLGTKYYTNGFAIGSGDVNGGLISDLFIVNGAVNTNDLPTYVSQMNTNWSWPFVE